MQLLRRIREGDANEQPVCFDGAKNATNLRIACEIKSVDLRITANTLSTTYDHQSTHDTLPIHSAREWIARLIVYVHTS